MAAQSGRYLYAEERTHEGIGGALRGRHARNVPAGLMFSGCRHLLGARPAT